MTESKEEVVYPDVLQYVEIKPFQKHSATVIFLHVSIHISFGAGICSESLICALGTRR